MNNDYNFFKVSDGHSLAYKVWNNVDSPQGIIIFIHGMAEHIERYDHLAQYLNSNNYIVYGLDQRGHGKTSGKRGYFHLNNGWKKVTDDQVEFYNYIRCNNPTLKISYFAHSMGSFILRYILANHNIEINKVILSGTGHMSYIKSKISTFLAGVITKTKGPTSDALFLDSMINGPFAKSVTNPTTKFDWLSRDSDQVAKYINDNECGFICTNKFYYDFFRIIADSLKKSKIKKIDKELPILLYSGDKDPVGGKSASDVKKLYSIYKKMNLNVSIKINSGGRHESINEINKNEVYSHIGDFIKS